MLLKEQHSLLLCGVTLHSDLVQVITERRLHLLIGLLQSLLLLGQFVNLGLPYRDNLCDLPPAFSSVHN